MATNEKTEFSERRKPNVGVSGMGEHLWGDPISITSQRAGA